MTVKKAESPTPRRSPKKTKDELQEAYQSELARVAEEKETELKPEKIAEEKKTATATQNTETLTVEGVSKDIHELKVTIGRTLGDLAEKLERQVARYQEVCAAINAKTLELNEIYGIEKAAGALVALIEAQNRKRDAFDQEMAQERTRLEAEIHSQREEWEKEQKEREAQIKETNAAEQQKTQRAKLEFEYAFHREQQLARDKFNDEKARLEKELAARKEAAEKDYAAREKTLKEAEAELADLRNKVQRFPDELAAAVKKAALEATEKSNAVSSANVNLLKKEFEGERNVLKARIESSQALVDKQTEQLAKLSQQQEHAYEKVQNIALKAIEGSSAREIAASLQDLLSDQMKKQAKSKDEK